MCTRWRNSLYKILNEKICVFQCLGNKGIMLIEFIFFSMLPNFILKATIFHRIISIA